MPVLNALSELSAQIQSSEVCRALQDAREEIARDAAANALLREYKRLQMQLQTASLTGIEAQTDITQRFEQLGAFLFENERTAHYLLCEMRVQQMLSEVYQALNAAAGLDMPDLG